MENSNKEEEELAPETMDAMGVLMASPQAGVLQLGLAVTQNHIPDLRTPRRCGHRNVAIPNHPIHQKIIL
jgi:hypothetical protein